MPKKVPVQDLEPGMTLAKPLTKGAMVILGEGTVLNETWISRIEDMGVDAVFIEGVSEMARPKEEEMALLETRFRKVIDRPYMRRIKEWTVKYVDRLYA